MFIILHFVLYQVGNVIHHVVSECLPIGLSDGRDFGGRLGNLHQTPCNVEALRSEYQCMQLAHKSRESVYGRRTSKKKK